MRGLASLFLLLAPALGWHDLNPSLRMAEMDAVAAWSAALHTDIEVPRIQVGTCPKIYYWGYLTVACADEETYSITVSERILHPGMLHVDLRTILMHEIGHLLGVPHIPGDALMDPIDRSPVSRPTPAALAAIPNPD